METGKNILNIKQKNVQFNSNTPLIQITQTADKVNLSIDRNFLLSASTFDITNTILTALSPLFIQKSFGVTQPVVDKKIASFKHIAFFIEHMPHYTGGRYSIFHQAVLLSQYTKVTVVTNENPPFKDDFKDYIGENFSLVKSANYLSDTDTTNFDLIIGCPMKSGQFAFHYAKKFSLPLYMILFESPNWIQKFRDGDDSNYEFWSGYKKCLFGADKIMVPSHESKKHLIEWMESDGRSIGINLQKEIHVVYPCLNQFIADKVKHRTISIKHRDSKFHVVYISRMTPFKTLIPLLKKFNDDGYIFHIIGKVWPDELKVLEQNKQVVVHGKISDVEKFKIIAEADAMVFPSQFEGFGMPPMEALYFNVPVIAYDLPVLREIYKDNIEFVPVGDVHKLIQAVKRTCQEGVEVKQNEWIKGDGAFSLVKNCARTLMDVCEIPKITVGIIVYNGEDYIEYAIKSIYNVVSQIIIVDGRVKMYDDGSLPESGDSTIPIIKRLLAQDVVNKIELVETKKIWKDKIEKQNEIAKRVTGTYYVKVDHDEIWKPETLIDVIKMMENDKRIGVVKMPFIHFWLNFNTIAKDAGGKWSTKHPRVWRWKKGFYHVKSFNYFQDLVHDYCKVGTPFVRESEYDGDAIYHFGYVRNLKTLQEKISYYKNRGIETFVVDTVSNWKEGMKTQPTQKVNSWADNFTGTLPEIMKQHPFFKIKDVRKIKINKGV